MAARIHDPNTPGAIRTSKLKLNSQGFWEVHWSENGRSRRQSCKTKDALEAKRWVKDWHDEIRAFIASTQAPRVPSVDALCARWLENAELQAHSKARTGTHALKVVRDKLGVYTIDELTDGVALQDYQDQRGASNGTIRRELGALRTVLNWAVKKRLIEPRAVPVFELPPQGAPRTKFLDRTQQAKFWDHAVAWSKRPGLCPRDRAAAERVTLLATLGLDTAARRGAIYALTWERVDLEQRVIDYRVPGERMTKKRKAIVAISDRLLGVLREAWDRAPKDAQGEAMGKVLSGMNVRGAFETFTRTIGMSWVTPHVLRHTYASLAAMNGVGVWDIAKMMGDTIATIEANYMHLAPGHLLHAANHYTRVA